MSISTDLDQHRRVVKEMTLVLQEFFHHRRDRFIPKAHLSEEAYALYSYYRERY